MRRLELRGLNWIRVWSKPTLRTQILTTPIVQIKYKEAADAYARKKSFKLEIGVYIGTNSIESVVASRAFMNTKNRAENQQFRRQKHHEMF
jgi:hypothetical protein